MAVRPIASVILCLALLVPAAGWLAGCGCQRDIEEKTTGQIDQAKDVAVQAAVRTIQVGIQAQLTTTGEVPAAADQATLGQFVNPWPENPFTKQPMKPGTGPGDYEYTKTGPTSYTLSVTLSDGNSAKIQ